eukprot:TRINITY_DN17794_c0_g1_i1.p1 TRINITY_DN17794_c0_g1~~TRINITY_DN17794_c0_g1_i1.p1  ORF type:complete len:748 (-),score=136.75 TRINITY_DN17794_c0_g1_i1:51-2027(-)
MGGPAHDHDQHGHSLHYLEGGTHTWNTDEYGYNFLEAVNLVILLCLALFFETFWHSVTGSLEHSYHYGMLLDRAYAGKNRGPRATVRHCALNKELADRAGGEFMTLGFLAFVIFVFNQAGGFALLVDVCREDPVDLHLPHSEADWLHIAELVHMKLFLGMLLYFFLVSRIVSGSVRQIKRWESLRLRSAEHHLQGLPVVEGADREMAQYERWRDFFLVTAYSWQDERPEAYAKILDTMGVSAEDDKNAFERLKERFNLSSYLALNVERGVRDSIVVHWTTWVVVIILISGMSLLHRYLHVTLLALTPGFFCCAVALLTGMWLTARCRQQTIGGDSPRRHWSRPGHRGTRSVSRSRLDKAVTTFAKSHQTELFMLRILQMVLFLLSYVFARTVADIRDWRIYPEKTGLCSALLGLVFSFLTMVLPQEVPNFIAVMALPPYVDHGNLVHLLQVLGDEHLRAEWAEIAELVTRASADAAAAAAEGPDGRSEGGGSPVSGPFCRTLTTGARIEELSATVDRLARALNCSPIAASDDGDADALLSAAAAAASASPTARGLGRGGAESEDTRFGAAEASPLQAVVVADADLRSALSPSSAAARSGASRWRREQQEEREQGSPSRVRRASSPTLPTLCRAPVNLPARAPPRVRSPGGSLGAQSPL